MMASLQRGGLTAATVVLALVGSARAVPLVVEGNNQTSSATTQETSKKSSGLSTTAMVVIVVGVVLVLALLGWIYCLTCKKKKKKSTKKKTTGDDAFPSVQTQQQQQSMEKSHEFHDEFGTHYVDIIDEHKIHVPRASGRPTGAPRTSRPAGEPALYNREVFSTFNNNSDSTRSYLHDLAAPAKNDTNRTPKIYASMNSVDFAYPDTDRSIAFSVTSDNYGHDYSSRSNDITDSYGFLIDSNRSSGVYADDEGDAVPSLRPKERALNRDVMFDQDVDTSELTTQQRRQIQVEI